MEIENFKMQVTESQHNVINNFLEGKLGLKWFTHNKKEGIIIVYDDLICDLALFHSVDVPTITFDDFCIKYKVIPDQWVVKLNFGYLFQNSPINANAQLVTSFSQSIIEMPYTWYKEVIFKQNNNMGNATENSYPIQQEIGEQEVIGKLYAVMVEGKQTPSKTYSFYNFAEKEAIRLAQIEKRTVYILMAVTKVELNDVKITNL